MKKNSKEKYKPFTQCIPSAKPELADKELLAAMDMQDKTVITYVGEQIREAFSKYLNAPIKASHVIEIDYDVWHKEYNVESPLTAPINPLTTVKIGGFKKAK